MDRYPWFVVVLLTIAAEWVIGMLLTLVVHFADTGWYDPKRISPRPARWCYRWWGRPIAVLWDAFMWPATLIEIVFSDS